LSDTKFVATLRTIFDAQDEMEAILMANEFQERIADLLDEDDIVDVTQVIPFETARQIPSAEMIEQLRRSRDLLIKTRIVQCFELARELDKTAWTLEHRAEPGFDMAGYDWGAFLDLTNRLLERKP